MKKGTILILAFVLPVTITVYLKFFTQHHYSVQVFYTDSLPMVASEDCSKASIPYKVQSSELDSILNDPSVLFVLYFLEDETQPNIAQSKLGRLSDMFDGSPVHLHVFVPYNSFFNKTDLQNSLFEFYPSAKSQVAFQSWNINEIDKLRNCALFMNEPNTNAVVLDDQKRIRGYFDLDDEEETRRLIAELKIILKEEYAG